MTYVTRSAAYNLGHLVETIRQEVIAVEQGDRGAVEALANLDRAAHRAEDRFRAVPPARYGPDPDDPRGHP